MSAPTQENIADIKASLWQVAEAIKAISKKWDMLTPYEMERAMSEMDNLHREKELFEDVMEIAYGNALTDFLENRRQRP